MLFNQLTAPAGINETQQTSQFLSPQNTLHCTFRTSAMATPIYGGSVIVNPSQQLNTQCLFTFIATAPSRTAELSQWIIRRWQWNASNMTACQ